jgi:hypothetical protein
MQIPENTNMLTTNNYKQITKLRENTSEKRRMRSLLKPIHLESNKYITNPTDISFRDRHGAEAETEKEVLDSHEASNTPQSYFFFTLPRKCAILEMNHTEATC